MKRTYEKPTVIRRGTLSTLVATGMSIMKSKVVAPDV